LERKYSEAKNNKPKKVANDKKVLVSKPNPKRDTIGALDNKEEAKANSKNTPQIIRDDDLDNNNLFSLNRARNQKTEATAIVPVKKNFFGTSGAKFKNGNNKSGVKNIPKSKKKEATLSNFEKEFFLTPISLFLSILLLLKLTAKKF